MLNKKTYNKKNFKEVKRKIDNGLWTPGLANNMPVYYSKRRSGFVSKFVSGGDNYCPSFFIIGSSSGSCYVKCKGCYLNGTYRAMYDVGVPVLYTNFSILNCELEKALQKTTGMIYSDGERCDSLLYDGCDWPVSENILPVFTKNVSLGNKWLRVTKSANINHLLSLDHQGVMIISFSINPQEIIHLFERNPVSTLKERLSAAKQLQDVGYPIRFRIDPIIYIENWEELYNGLIGEIAELDLNPDVITLGSYRILKRSVSSFKITGDLPAIPLNDLFDGSNGSTQARLRYPDELRIEGYSALIEQIRKCLPLANIGLCKESKTLRDSLGFCDKMNVCNCVLS